jgi:hypothetical protein
VLPWKKSLKVNGLKKALPFSGTTPVSSASPVMAALNLQMQTV